MHQAVIVDDEKIIVDGLQEAIDWEGYQFEVALATTCPFEALDYITEHSGEVKLLVTDISMPELSGIELIQRVKEIDPHLSVVVLSAYDNFEYVRSALRYGAKNYLLKPVDENELGDTVRQIVQHVEEREEASSRYGPNTFTFRSNFTENWVKGNMSPNEIHSRAEILGVNLEARHYTTILCTVKEESPERVSQFFDLFLEEIIGAFLGNFYFETPNRMVCVLSALDDTTLPVEKFLTSFSSKWQKQQFSAFISYGPSVKYYSEVGRSYQKAKTMHLLALTNLQVLGTFSLEPAVKEVIQQSYQTMNPELYGKEIRQLFYSGIPPVVAKRIATQIIAWGLGELGDETENLTSDDKLAELVESFPPEVTDSEKAADQYAKFAVHFSRLCYEKVQSITQALYPCVNAVLEIIHEFSDDDISLKNLAKQLNISPSYLGSIFKEQTGDYFNDYLTKARLEYATQLILETDMIIKDIVDTVGFSSQTYFNRIFKNHYNLTPIEYRRKARIDTIGAH